MSKYLKKKIRNTLPLIVIFCLLNVLVLGFSFNLNLNFVKPIDKGFVNLAPGAEASTATTTVMVKNSPPHFTAGPAENPSSDPTTPINVGANIGFTGTASDDEGDSYWMVLCTTTKATTSPINDLLPPTCVNGNALCVTAKASSSNAVSCTYNNIKDPGSETQVWYAIVCDGHWGDRRCSVSAQGAGNSGSPFYVNHAPRINKLHTTVDFRNPGQAVTIVATTTDYDHASGNYNVQNLYVCSTNGWSAISGCTGGLANELCHGSSSVPSTASTSVSCNYTVPTPSQHTGFTYYGFIKDQFKMPAVFSQGSSSLYFVNNVAPVVANVSLNKGNNIGLNIKNAPGVIVKASSTSVTDNNGCTDLTSATSTIYISSVTNGNHCAANGSYCYKATSTLCTISNCSGPSSVTATIICSTTFAFYAMPTDASSKKASSSSWYAAVEATDALGLKGVGFYNTSNGVEVNSTAALSMVESSIPYGIVQAGTNTGATNASTTVVNYGNTPIDTAVMGTDMLKNKVGPEKIRANNQQHSVNTFSFTAGNTSSTTPDTIAVGISRPINSTDLTAKTYWGINIPAGTPAAQFYGVNTFTVVLNQLDNWQYNP
jgi:hypothetical protein